MNFKGILTVLSIALNIFAFGQEGVNAWEENYSAVSHGQQSDAGSVAIDITNQSRYIADCISKAKQQALYVAIFKGYGKSNSGPASAPLADKQVYNQNIDFFKTYLASNMEGLSFVTKAKTNIKKPGSKISKKVIETTTTVYINKALLQKDLENQGIIKGIADLGFKPEVLIVPGDAYMKRLNFVKTIDNQGQPVEVYDYTKAVNDEFFNSLGLFVKSKYDDAFEMADFKSKLDAINAEVQKNNMRSDVMLKESNMDIFSRVVAAELWLKLDVVEQSVSGGMEMQYTITMSALDPLTQRTVINGLPQTIKTVGDNKMQLLENTINAVSDEFRPRVIKYFTEREENGLQGKIMFYIDDNLELDFNSDIDVDGDEYEFAEVIDAMVSKNSKSSSTSGSQTSTRRTYDVSIPTKIENKLSGEIVTNNYEKFGRKVNRAVKKFGYKATIESQGLGSVIVIFTEEL